MQAHAQRCTPPASCTAAYVGDSTAVDRRQRYHAHGAQWGLPTATLLVALSVFKVDCATYQSQGAHKAMAGSSVHALDFVPPPPSAAAHVRVAQVSRNCRASMPAAARFLHGAVTTRRTPMAMAPACPWRVSSLRAVVAAFAGDPTRL